MSEDERKCKSLPTRGVAHAHVLGRRQRIAALERQLAIERDGLRDFLRSAEMPRKRSLREHIVAVLAMEGREMRIPEIVTEIEKQEYETQSCSKLGVLVAGELSRHLCFERVSRGVHRLRPDAS